MTGRPLTEQLLDLFDAGHFHLPVGPAVVERFETPPEPAGTGSGDCAELIRLDPALTCRLFQAANSAFYQGLPKAASLGEALTRIGTTGATALLRESCREPSAAAGTFLVSRYLPSLWRHSFGCALGACWLAERCGFRELGPQAYLGGLLHDIGKWLLLALLDKVAAGGDNRARLADQLIEEVLESMHVELGLRLVTQWNLPDDLVRVVGRHHQEGQAGQELLVALVRLANQGCRKLGLGWSHDPGLILPATAEAQFLGLDELALAEYEILLEDQFGLAPAGS